MTRQDERAARAAEEPIVGSLPQMPGITVAMSLTPDLGRNMRGLADALLVNDFPGATIGRPEREMIATSVSAGNDCFYCMDSHGAFATALLERDGRDTEVPVIDLIKAGDTSPLDPKMQALLHIAQVVRSAPRSLTAEHVQAATAVGASDGDVQLAVLIAAGFSMYNRMVDGLRAVTPSVTEAYRERATVIAEHGYSMPTTPLPAVR